MSSFYSSTTWTCAPIMIWAVVLLKPLGLALVLLKALGLSAILVMVLVLARRARSSPILEHELLVGLLLVIFFLGMNLARQAPLLANLLGLGLSGWLVLNHHTFGGWNTRVMQEMSYQNAYYY